MLLLATAWPIGVVLFGLCEDVVDDLAKTGLLWHLALLARSPRTLCATRCGQE